MRIRPWIALLAGRRRTAWARDSRGMSLTELLVVLVILGTMAAIAVPMFLQLGPFARGEAPRSARDLYSFLRAAKIYSATYRVEAGLAYGVALKLDSITGQAMETIDASAMIYKMPDYVRERCIFPGDTRPQESEQWKDDYAYVPVTGEHEQGMFRPLVKDTGVLCPNLLPSGDGALSLTLRDVRIYQVAYIGDPAGRDPLYRATLVTPLIVSDNDTDVLSALPPRLQYLAALPAGQKFLEYMPDTTGPPDERNKADFRYPAHLFLPSGRMDTGDDTAERFQMSVGYAPDASPEERYVAVPYNKENERKIDLELYRSTGRVAIVTD